MAPPPWRLQFSRAAGIPSPRQRKSPLATLRSADVTTPIPGMQRKRVLANGCLLVRHDQGQSRAVILGVRSG
jgi:hypothetical protein